MSGRRGTGLLGLIILVGVLTTMLAVAVILVVVAVPIGAVPPLVVLSLLAGARQRQIVAYVTRHHRAIDVIAGTLLIAVGVGDFLFNLDSLRLTFGF